MSSGHKECCPKRLQFICERRDKLALCLLYTKGFSFFHSRAFAVVEHKKSQENHMYECYNDKTTIRKQF